jgi:hypothetical protein
MDSTLDSPPDKADAGLSCEELGISQDDLEQMLVLASAGPPQDVYEPSPLKRKRRTKSEVVDLRIAIYNTLWAAHPQTVRQLYYRLTVNQVIEKTDPAYKLVCRMTADMRRDGSLPYEWLADNTRWMRKPKTYASLTGMLEHQQEFYRRDLWAEQDAYVEIWLEKDALSGVLFDVTAVWDVPLMVTRGYPSLSFLHSAGEQIADEQRPVYLYYFGDHDPSGVDITRAVEQGIREFAPNVDLHFERVAVTLEQIDKYELPARPTKGSDSRSRNFDGESVEVDALPVEVLKSICETCITQHLDADRHNRLLLVEEAERSTLAQIAASMQGGAA